MTVYDPKTGQPVEVDEKTATAGILAGTYGFPKSDRIPVVNPDGKVGSVPAPNVGKALASGYRLPSSQEREHYQAEKDYGGTAGEIEAGLAGAARGATLGLSDKVLSLNPGMKKVLAGLKEANPFSSGVGEIGGTAASLLLAPEASGPGLVGKLGAGAERATAEIAGKELLGRVAAKAVGGMTEGGLYGLGQFISDQALSTNPELDGEKLFAATGGGMLTGGVLGGGGELFMSGMRKGASSLMKTLGGKGLNEALSDFAEQRALSTVGIGSDANRFGLQSAEERSKIARYMLDELPLTAGDNAASIFDKAKVASRGHWENISAIAKDIDERGVPFDTPRFTARATQELLDPIEHDPAKASTYNALKNLIEGYQAYGPGGEAGPMSFQKAWELQSSLRQKLGLADSLFAARNEVPRLRQLFQDEIYNQANDVSPHFGEMLRGESRNYRNAEVIEQMAKGAVKRQDLNNPYSLFDRMTALGAGAIVGGPVGLGAAGLGLVGNKLMRERGRSLVAVAADRLAQSGILGYMADGLKNYVGSALETSPVWAGTFRSTLERAMARGSDNLLATHIQLAKNDPTYLAAVGLENESPELANAVADRADKFTQLAAVIKEHDAKIDQAVARFLGKQSGAAPSSDTPTLTAKEFQEQFQQLEALKDTQAVSANLNGATDSPTMNAIMGAVAVRALGFMQNQAPRNPSAQPMKALSEPWQPSEVQLALWARIVYALQQPEQLLHGLRDGTTTREEVAAVGAVYPKLLASFQQKLTTALAGHDTPLSYPQKLALSRLMGSPVGNAGDPNRFTMLQGAHNVTIPNGPTPSAAAAKVDGRQRVDVVQNYQTQSQRSEARAGVA